MGPPAYRPAGAPREKSPPPCYIPRMDYQFVGFVFACIGAVMSVLYFGLGVSLLKMHRKNHREPVRSRPNDAR